MHGIGNDQILDRLKDRKQLLLRIKTNLLKQKITQEHLCHMAINDNAMNLQEAASILEISMTDINKWIDKFVYDVKFLKILFAVQRQGQELPSEPDLALAATEKAINDISKEVENYSMFSLIRPVWLGEISASLAEHKTKNSEESRQQVA